MADNSEDEHLEILINNQPKSPADEVTLTADADYQKLFPGIFNVISGGVLWYFGRISIGT